MRGDRSPGRRPPSQVRQRMASHGRDAAPSQQLLEDLLIGQQRSRRRSDALVVVMVRDPCKHVLCDVGVIGQTVHCSLAYQSIKVLLGQLR